jgi:magnesium-transporting ATPase (P-type)
MEARELKVLNEKFGGIEGIMKSLGSSHNGIGGANTDIEARQKKYGINEMAKPKTKSFLRLWAEAFYDITLIILMVLAVVSLIIAFAVERGAELSWYLS